LRRDLRLQGLSSDHHAALVLARRIERGEVDVAGVRERFDADLAPHFAIEEEVLLPALREVGEATLAERTSHDHDTLRAHLAAAEAGALAGLASFGRVLAEHVRFEEQEVFPACESRLAPAILAEVARRAPKQR